MTDYKEEQNNEIEALESIYPEELKVLKTEPYHQFQMPLTFTYKEWQQPDETVSCTLNITYTPTYPDEAPIVEIAEDDLSDNLDGEQLTKITDLIQEQIEENLGTVMVFILVSAVQEKLADIAESISTEKKERKERELKEEEEREQKRFEGTVVTIESFLKWKEGFDADMAEQRRALGQEKVNTKPTGKELFMRDNTFDNSDVAFLDDDTDVAVAVDESLFQDLDDLDLDEELDLES